VSGFRRTLAKQIVERFADRVTHVGVAIVTPDAGTDVAWTPAAETLEPAYLAYSITKTFTATLFLRWEDEGVVILDDRLARWRPEVPGAERISLRQLLNHTAGIPDYGPMPRYSEAVRTSPMQPWSRDQFAAETYTRGLLFEPGSSWRYSNPGYMLLSQIAESIGGMRYAALVVERIARPLGLTRTFVPESIADLATLAPARSHLLSSDGALVDVRDRYHPGWVSHGVVASTPSEIARFFDALFRGGLVSARARDDMTTLVRVPGEPGPGWLTAAYGLGLMGSLTPAPWGRAFGHNGAGPGYGASAFHACEHGVSICAMGEFEGTGVEAPAIVDAAFDLMTSIR
jgi:D-alanyl-D-alanine carboxypeptidase